MVAIQEKFLTFIRLSLLAVFNCVYVRDGERESERKNGSLRELTRVYPLSHPKNTFEVVQLQLITRRTHIVPFLNLL
jgi:hypothetical protein